MIEADFGHQPLKSGAIVSRLAAEALVIINDDDALEGPTQSLCEFGESVLPLSRFSMTCCGDDCRT